VQPHPVDLFFFRSSGWWYRSVFLLPVALLSLSFSLSLSLYNLSSLPVILCIEVFLLFLTVDRGTHWRQHSWSVSSSWSFLLGMHTSRDRNRATYLPHYILLSRKPESLFFNITLSSSFMPFVMSHLFSSLLVICLFLLDLSHSLLIYITLFLSLSALCSLIFC